MSDFFSSKIALDTTKAKACTESIRSPVLADIARTHAENVEDTLTLLALPLTLLGAGVADAYRVAFFAQALASMGDVTKWRESNDAKKEIKHEVNRLLEEHNRSVESGSAILDEAELRFEEFAKNPNVESSLRILLYAAISASWATLESLSKDLWIAALNARPTELAQGTFRHLPESLGEGDLTKKHVPVGLLARYGFDVRDKLGTILSARFDFTSYIGIRTAYTAVFGDKPALRTIFEDPAPQALEAVRHLIVHRAGHVDDEYIRRTGEQAPIGRKLEITGQRFTELAEGAVKVGCSLLGFVDEFLVSVRLEPPSDAQRAK